MGMNFQKVDRLRKEALAREQRREAEKQAKRVGLITSGRTCCGTGGKSWCPVPMCRGSADIPP